jgi:hypothetical protein
MVKCPFCLLAAEIKDAGNLLVVVCFVHLLAAIDSCLVFELTWSRWLCPPRFMIAVGDVSCELREQS